MSVGVVTPKGPFKKVKVQVYGLVYAGWERGVLVQDCVLIFGVGTKWSPLAWASSTKIMNLSVTPFSRKHCQTSITWA